MPIFDYVCQNCGHSTEVMQKAGAEPLVDCPACGKPSFQKALSAPRFRLSGGGWYETDEKPKSQQRNVVKKDDSGQSAETK